VGGRRVVLLEPGSEGLFAEAFELGLSFPPSLGGDVRDFGQAASEGAEVEAGAADHDRRAASRCDLVQHGRGGPQPAPDRPAVGRVHRAE
jgi:hypothetical protein